MARLARLVIPGCAHYVLQHAAAGREIFFEAADYEKYLALLRLACAGNDVVIDAWCLSPNCSRLVLRPATHEGLARAMGETHRLFARHRGKGGSALWHGRFKSCPLDPALVSLCIAHIERSVSEASWPWVSASGQTVADASDLATIESAILTGRPAGSPDFVARIEYETGRRLGPRRRGRPRKW
jgi:REP-associated tyrosine transposase